MGMWRTTSKRGNACHHSFPSRSNYDQQTGILSCDIRGHAWQPSGKTKTTLSATRLIFIHARAADEGGDLEDNLANSGGPMFACLEYTITRKNKVRDRVRHAGIPQRGTSERMHGVSVTKTQALGQ